MIRSLLKKLFKYKFLVLLLILNVFIYRNWFFSNQLFTFGDVGIYTAAEQGELLTNIQSIYTSDRNFGEVNIFASGNPLTLLFAILFKLGINFIWTEKLVLFIPIILISSISSFHFIKVQTNSNIGSFLGSLFYSFNPYFLITLTGALYISLAYALTPVLFLSLKKLIDKKSTFVSTVIFVLIASIIGFIEFRILYINSLIMSIYLIFELIILNKINRSEIIRLFKKAITVASFFILINLFWLLPLSILDNIVSNEIFSRSLFGDQYFDIINSLTVYHPWWTGNIPSIFIKQSPSLIFFITPLIVFLVLFYSKIQKKTLGFIAIFIFGVVLTKQTSRPFGQIYLVLFKYFPGFNAFREASKFFLASAFSSSVIIGYFFSKTVRVPQIIKKIIGAVLSILLLSQMSMVSKSKLGTMFIGRSYPVEYDILNEFIDKQDDYFRVLWFPHTNRFGTSSKNHPEVSVLSNLEVLNKRLNLENNNFTLQKRLISVLEGDKANAFLDLASVKYVIIPSDLIWDEVNSPWKNPQLYLSDIDNYDYLDRLDHPELNSHNIHIYQNSEFRPHLYSTLDLDDADSLNPFKEISNKQVNTSQYSFVLENVSKPIYINISENYHPQWKLRIGEFNLFKALLEGSYFQSVNEHFSNTAGFNSFYVDPDSSCLVYECQLNENGTYNIHLTIFFLPQLYYVIGYGISALTFFSLTLILVVSKLRTFSKLDTK